MSKYLADYVTDYVTKKIRESEEFIANQQLNWLLTGSEPLSIGEFDIYKRREGLDFVWNPEKNKKAEIKDVIFNNPATIVFWNDGTKTVVKAENEAFDPEKGLAMAISKKFLGNKGNYFEVFKKYIKEDQE